jgi:hypothetical protein
VSFIFELATRLTNGDLVRDEVDGCTYARLPPDNEIEDNDSGREAPMAKRILVVEDNEDNRFMLVQILRFSGYER